MSPSSGELADDLDEKYLSLVVKFVANINTGKLEGSCNIALATLTLLEQIVNDIISPSTVETEEKETVEEEEVVRKRLLTGVRVVRAAGGRLSRALPCELVVGNVVRRVLRVLRDVARNKAEGAADGGDSLQRLVRGGGTEPTDADSEHGDGLRSLTLGYIDELRSELEGSASAVEQLSGEQLHAHELVLTLGASRLVERFLRRAFATRPFSLVVVSSGPQGRCHAMAARLAAAGVPLTVVGAAHAAAVMARANKCVLGVRAVLAGGALLATAGTHALALAADHHSVPLVALAPLYKLTPTYASCARSTHALASPQAALPYQCDPGAETHAYSPLYDHVPPDLVTLFVTNHGAFSPSYIYRQLSELYDPSDYQL